MTPIPLSELYRTKSDVARELATYSKLFVGYLTTMMHKGFGYDTLEVLEMFKKFSEKPEFSDGLTGIITQNNDDIAKLVQYTGLIPTLKDPKKQDLLDVSIGIIDVLLTTFISRQQSKIFIDKVREKVYYYKKQ